MYLLCKIHTSGQFGESGYLDGDGACARDTMKEEGVMEGRFIPGLEGRNKAMQLVRSLGDLDGHLVRSWIVSREARARMMMCSVWTYYCRTAEDAGDQ